MSIVLVVNSGSSSLKYQLIEMADESMIAKGLIERIGEPLGAISHSRADGEKAQREAPVPDHEAAFEEMRRNFDEFGPDLAVATPVAVGHRVVQGGRRFFVPTIVDDEVEADIADLIPLAPLHNPANLAGVQAARRLFDGVPHVTVFDTAFHTTMPDAASRYAIDLKIADEYRIRKYGAHGTSHKFVSEETANFLGRPLELLNTVILHVGNGASACAVRGGKSLETSMGLTPLEGLVMGTRSGDIDPAVVFHLSRKAGWDIDELDDFLNRRSGMQGLAGTNDMRDIEQRMQAGDELADLAFSIYIHRLRHYVGSYLVTLDGGDAIAWCAGVGEHSPLVRERTLSGLEWLGVEIDPERNWADGNDIREISSDRSRVRVLVVPTNEELEIARQTLEATGIPAV